MKSTALLLALCKVLGAADRVAAIAHRGEHRVHPENTLPAFQAAIDARAGFFESDVRTTSDGRLVLRGDGSRSSVPSPPWVSPASSPHRRSLGRSIRMLFKSGYRPSMRSATCWNRGPVSWPSTIGTTSTVVA